MAGGMAASSGPVKRYPGRTTPYVVIACIVAASGGALFGTVSGKQSRQSLEDTIRKERVSAVDLRCMFCMASAASNDNFHILRNSIPLRNSYLCSVDNGVTGGVVAMPGFLEKFFPGVAAQVKVRESESGNGLKQNPYCTFDDQGLQWFTSSLFIAGMVASLPAGWMVRHYGRKFTMLVAGILFDIGVVFITGAWHLSILIIGRVLLGIAVAFASVAVTLYNSEMAPAHLRGRLNQIFQVVLSLGILLAQAVNIGTQHIYPWGWRISLAIAGVPAIVLTLGGVYLPDTPNSLIERGKEAEGRKVLQDIRGISNVDEEFADICAACKQSNLVKNPWRNLLSAPYRPQLVIALTATLFQQWTGINTVIFYSPQLFVTLGTGTSGALIATIVTGVVNHFATYVSLWAADAYGRRILWMQAGVQMIIALVVIACTLAIAGTQTWVAWFILVFICIYIAAYAWSWGPLAWLYPSEVQPLETRSAGQSLATMINLTFSFVIGQTYLSMLCSLRWGIFLFFAGCIFFMTVFVYFLYPETKGLAIEDAPKIFKRHWFWKHYANRIDHTMDQDLLATRTKSGLEQQNSMSANGTINGYNSGVTLNPLMREGGDLNTNDSEVPSIVVLQRDENDGNPTLMHRQALSDDPFWNDNDEGDRAEVLAPSRNRTTDDFSR